MVASTSSQTSHEDFLEAARYRADPLADRFVKDLAETKEQKELYMIMGVLLNEYIWIGSEKLDPKAEKLLIEASKLPPWYDEKLAAKGSEFFAIHGFEISMILLMKALPATYCCAKGAQVVYSTGRLTDHSGNMKPFTRRLMQTSKFILNVMAPDGYEKDGSGIRSAVKVRTLHAFVRHFLNDNGWDAEKYGVPINQEDYAGTMLSFSVFVIEGLETIGVKISQEEKEAYYHIWRTVAYLVGVEEEMIPTTYDEGAKLGHAILDDQKASSQEGIELTKASIEFCEEFMPWILRYLPENMMYHLLGPELAAMVNVKHSSNIFVRAAFTITKWIIKLYERLKTRWTIVYRWAKWINPKLLDKLIHKFLEQTRHAFSPGIVREEISKIEKVHGNGG